MNRSANCRLWFGRLISKTLVCLALLSPLGGARTATPDEKLLDETMRHVFDWELAPGMAVAVVQQGRPAYVRGFGYRDIESKEPVHADTIFYVASVTKSFTGMAFASLEHRGTIDLDAPVTRYLSGGQFHPEIDPTRVSLRQLLTHTHGISGNGPVSFRLAYSGQHSPDLLKKLLQFHAPAITMDFQYSNIGYNVATMASDDFLDGSWKDVLDREVFQPIGMKSTSAYRSRLDPSRLAAPHRLDSEGFAKAHYGKSDANMQSAGGVMTSAVDLARWLEINLSIGILDGRQVLPQAVITEAHSKHADCDAEFGPYIRKGYGLGWYIGPFEGRTMLHHFGGFPGFHAHVSMIPEAGVGVAVLVNTGRTGMLMAAAAANSAYDILLDMEDRESRLIARKQSTREVADRMRDAIKADRQRRAARPQELPHPLEAYTGTYSSRLFGEVVVSVVDGKLEATMGPLWSAIEVFDGEKNQLRTELTGQGVVLRFTIPEGATRAKLFRMQDQVFRRVD